MFCADLRPKGDYSLTQLNNRSVTKRVTNCDTPCCVRYSVKHERKKSTFAQQLHFVSLVTNIFRNESIHPLAFTTLNSRWKVAGSIPDGVIGIFHWNNPSGRNMALELTQPLTEMSIRNTSCGVKAVGAYGWQPYHFHVPIVLKSGRLNLLEQSGPVQACHGIALQCGFMWNLQYLLRICEIIHYKIILAINLWE